MVADSQSTQRRLPFGVVHRAPPTVSPWARPDPIQGEPANAVVDRWNGSNWSQEATPGSNNTEDFLTSVSCPTATYCMAIGQSYFVQTNGSAALAEQWNGTTWTIAASP